MTSTKRTQKCFQAVSRTPAWDGAGLVAQRGYARAAAACFVVAALVLISLFGAISLPYAFAEEPVGLSTVDDLERGKKLKELKDNELMNNNYGTITTNNGSVVKNYGTITSCGKYGFVRENHGQIGVSYGVVLSNYGSIAAYYGHNSITHEQMQFNGGNIMRLAGHLTYNGGTVGTATGGWRINLNDRNATIKDLAGGSFVIDNLGTVERVSQGDVQNNYGTVKTVEAGGRVHNQFYKVNAQAVYTETVPDGVHYEGLDEYALSKHYGNYVLEGNTVTLKPAEGWYIAGYSGLDGQASATLSDDGTSLVLANVTGDIDITVRMGKLYNLVVGGKRVTTSNCNDVFGDGSVSYNPLTNTLFFINATIDALGTGHAGLEADSAVNLYFEGDCSIRGDKGYGGMSVHGDVLVKESNDDFSLKIMGRGASGGVYYETAVVYGTLTIEDGAIEIENSLNAGAFVQTGGDVVVRAAGGPQTGGVISSIATLSGGTFTSYGPLGAARCQLTISGADVVFDCAGTSRWCGNSGSTVVVAPPEGKVISAIYGTSTSDSAKNEAVNISGSPFGSTTSITGYVNPGAVPYDAKSSYFATKSGVPHTVSIYDGDELRSTYQMVEGVTFAFAANAPEGYIVNSVSAQAKSGATVAIEGPDENQGYSLVMPHDEVAVRFAYKPITYSIAYDANCPIGASTTVTGTTPEQSDIAYGSSVALSANGFVLNGYEFLGWNTARDGSGSAYEDGATVNNLASEQGKQIVLYAQWRPHTYQVAFDGNGAAGSMAPQTFTFDQSASLHTVAFSLEGHSFQCWKRLALGASISYADGQAVRNLNASFDDAGKPTDNTLVAQWQSNETIAITVLKDQRPLSGIANRISLKQGETVFQGEGMLSEQSAGVYVFQQTEEFKLPEEGTFSVCIDGEDTMQMIVLSQSGTSKTSAVVAYYSVSASAQWAGGGADPCSVSLVSGAALSGENCFVSGSVVSIEVDASTIAEGYSFDCWVALESQPSGEAWDPRATQCSFALAGTVDMLATQAANTYYVSFDANVPANCSTVLAGAMLDQKLWYDSETMLVACDYVLPCYVFRGWNSAPDGSGMPFANEARVRNLTTVQDATVTLFAQWEPISYLIEYNSNGGIGPSNYQECAYDEVAALATMHFVKPNYHFVRWNTASDGSGTPYEADAMVLNLATEQSAVVTLYAQWERDEYIVAYDANEPPIITQPVEGLMEESTFYLGEQAPLPLCAYTLEGFVFTGWNTAPDGSGTAYENGEAAESLATIRNARITLYAQWERDPSFYRFIEGMGGVWTRGDASTLPFKTNGAYGLFEQVLIDDQVIARENYAAWSGSTNISLMSDFLQTLATGEHTITAVYADGRCSTTFTVAEEGGGGGGGDIVDTGDPFLPVVIAIVAAAAVTLTVLVIAIAKLRRR